MSHQPLLRREAVLAQEVAVNAVQEQVHSLRAQGRKLEATRRTCSFLKQCPAQVTNIANHCRWLLDFDSSLALLWNVFTFSPILFIKGWFQKFPLFLLDGRHDSSEKWRIFLPLNLFGLFSFGLLSQRELE